MFNKKEADKKDNQRIIDSYDYLSDAVSMQECTGLIPSAPLTEGDFESYDQIFKYQTPEVPEAKKFDF